MEVIENFYLENSSTIHLKKDATPAIKVRILLVPKNALSVMKKSVSITALPIVI